MVGSQGLVLLITLALIVADIQEVNIFLFGRVVAYAVSSTVAIILVVQIFGLRFQRGYVQRALRKTLPFGASVALVIIYRQADILYKSFPPPSMWA